MTMNAPKFSVSNLATVIALLGSFAVFLMRYEGRISKIENTNDEQQHRIERLEGLARDMYPKLERVNTNLEWLVQREKERKEP
jgi:hypothetical protein